jgi:hypothetical protein
MQPGMLPWKWFLDPGADERELEDKTAEAYVGFVEHLPYVAVLDPQDRAEPGQAQVVVTLEGREGAPLRLELGARDAQGRVALWVETSATLYQVAGAHLDLVATSREALTRAYSEDDPWTAALRGADH